MKYRMIYAIAAMLLFFSIRANAATTADPVNGTPSVNLPPEAKALYTRLDEIKQIDKSTLTPAEKKQLRKETRHIKKQLKELGGGVYLSAGAVVLIVVLLIILL